MRRHDACPTWHHHIIDVEALAAGYLGRLAYTDDAGSVTTRPHHPPWHSEQLSRAINVDPRQFARHTALGDARWARAMYDKVMGAPKRG